MKELRLILGDQLNAAHSWFKHQDDQVVYLIAELIQEINYVIHHVQKVTGFFAAMQQFAQALQQAGHQVDYLTLDETAQFKDLPDLLANRIALHNITQFSYQAPDEYRLDQQLSQFAKSISIPTTMADTEHFLTSRDAWNSIPHSRMEFFYRHLRKIHNVLMDSDGKPLGGRWNFDSENRNRLPDNTDIPEPLLFSEDVSVIYARLQRHQVKTLGSLDPHHFIWPVNRQQARQLLQYFLHQCLPHFGQYQDAMTERGWSLFHSRLSFCLNTKMLQPIEVIRAAESHWRAHQQAISLAQIEGFIRQILGWREYVRAVYWAHMPDYSKQNYLSADRGLPDFYWTGQTRMQCMAHAITQSLEHAYAHHIQRLMVTGNFTLLAGIHPDEVDHWYLGIYMDAIEWVELPNTRGMSLFADGGLIASKPYAASGNYLNKMSHYCKNCHYDVKRRSGANSCPFNSLYWHFIHRHADKFSANPRMAMVYRNWQKFSKEEQQSILSTAETNLENIQKL
ncbi:cryptochrome/photolyase family protein [Nitrincola sp.]|uniref:cryptochrome/photolyase family protein n=1 Tax=Nitrincola sp. TaxID=1926584 RepID=UPI003A8E3460